MTLVPLELRELNALISSHHRHHKPVQGHRFSIGARVGDRLVGAASVGRPVARLTDSKSTLEVTRLVTDGTKNACSFLYTAAARIGKELGYSRIQTFILDSETGVSLIAAGWEYDGETTGGAWERLSKQNRRTDQPMGKKHRYIKVLKSARTATEGKP